MKRILSIIIAAVFLLSLLPASAADGGEKELRILFTHDIHSHFVNTAYMADGELREYGGAARLKTLLDENSTENCVYVDAGDFSMGTLLQANYATDAYELRLLGELGCAVTTFGNHEFDYGDESLAGMLEMAQRSGDRLPQIVQSNMVMDGELTEGQQMLADALDEYGVEKYVILDINGIKAAFFGLFGLDCLECTPTTEMEFINYIESAKEIVSEIKEKESPDVIVCLSHCGTAGDGATGEDFDLAKEVPDIDVIISGHSHTKYNEPIMAGSTVIVSCGANLTNLGVLDLTISEGGVSLEGYELVSCNERVAEDEEMTARIAEYKQRINETYLADEGVGYDDVICRSEFDFMSFEEMEATHQEYPFGNLIADSYIYEAKRNGIDDIDAALVGLGTIRGTFTKGDITTGEAFEICSLGVGADSSAGHPIICGYITGSELKLIAELDASLGPMMNSIKMSYSGLSYTFNTKRMLLDRVTDICLVREDGTREEIEDDKLYKVACNMYAANMLGMVNGLTHGVLKVVPKFADGTEVEDLYDCSLYNTDGKEIKEWVAFKNYLMSMPEKDGVPTISEKYAAADGRKIKVSEGGLAVIRNPGLTTAVVIAVPAAVALLIAALCLTRKRRKARRQMRKAAKAKA